MSDYLEFKPDSSLLVKEDGQRVIQQEVNECIEAGRPIQYIHSNSHLGDHFIIRSALELVLNKYAEQKGLKKPLVSLSHEPQEASVNFKNLCMTFGNHHFLYEAAFNNLHKGIMVWAAQHLGITLTYEKLESIPMPYTCDFEGTPMRNFSWTEVGRYVNELREYFNPGDKYCVILHAGSNPLKRYLANQVRAIGTTIHTLFPKNKIAILTAQNIDKSNGLSSADGDFFLDATEDINKTFALFLALPEVTYIPTDTFLGWLGSSAIASRIDRGGKLREKDVYILYTLASTEYWGIPGANKFASKVIQDLNRKGRLTTAVDNIIDPTYYMNFWRHTGVSEDEIDRIAAADIAGFLRFIAADNAQDF